MDPVKLGSNDFFGVPFPVVIGDRFFHIYPDEASPGRFLVDVFRWDPATGADYEVRASKSLDENARDWPTGHVTFTEEDGGFLFKFRPQAGQSQLFGGIPADRLKVLINDHELAVMDGETRVMTITKSTVSGGVIGLDVQEKGIGFGSNRVPPGMRIVRAA